MSFVNTMLSVIIKLILKRAFGLGQAVGGLVGYTASQAIMTGYHHGNGMLLYLEWPLAIMPV